MTALKGREFVKWHSPRVLEGQYERERQITTLPDEAVFLQIKVHSQYSYFENHTYPAVSLCFTECCKLLCWEYVRFATRKVVYIPS